MKHAAKSLVIAYDISDSRERKTVDHILKQYGSRIQKSVFLCHISKGAKVELVRLLEDLHLETGFVSIFTSLANSRPQHIGTWEEPDDTPDLFLI